ncbi:MAG: 2-C-methyl-D-erythritol 4-phosphate cytidylyltransferase [Nanoarchaeota archaeon]|nr:2-C-methyl-D-erythritol 4-phosphate cytidylyltransferase [Nanoarchaeota archaeon]
MKTVGVVLASGIGQRFGAAIPKQFMTLNNKMVIQYVIDALKESGVDYLICTLPGNYYSSESMKGIVESIQGIDKFVVGGDSRSETVINALKACPQDTKYVIFMDSVRPFMKSSHIKRCLDKLKNDPEIKYVVTGQKITDSLFSILPHLSGNKVVRGEDREKFKLCQSPEVFDFETINKIYQNNDFIRITNPENVAKVFNFYPHIKGEFIDYAGTNMKITYEEDLCKAEQFMKYVKFEEMKDINIDG